MSAKIDNARPLVGWALDGVLTPAEGTNVERKLAALDEVGEILEHLSDAITWKHYAQEVSRRLSIAPDLLEEYIRRPASARSRVRQAVVQAHQPLELDAAEHGILTMLLGHPEWLESFLADDLDNLLSTRELAEFLEQAVDHYRKYDQIKPAILLEAIGQPAFQRTVTEALADDELDPDKALRFYKDCIRSLKKKWASRTLDELTRQLDHIDFYDDRDRYEQLTRQKQEIDQFKASLDWKPTS